METTRVHAPITSARSCEDAAGNARVTRDSDEAAAERDRKAVLLDPLI